MEQSPPDSASHQVGSGNDSWWHRLLGWLDAGTGDRAWLITIALSGFVLIKVIWIARGNIQTALAVFNSAGLVTVVTGGLLSAFPLVSALALGFVVFYLTDRQICRRRPARNPVKNPVIPKWFIWFIGIAAVAGCFFLTPWPIMAASVLFGFSSALAAHMKEETKRKRAALLVLSVLMIYLVLNPLLYAVWLPHEMLTVPERATKKYPNGKYVFGYVLSDSNGWISVLQTGERNILRFRSEKVTARALCHGQTVPMAHIPYLQIPRSYKSADSLSDIVPGFGTTIPPCSPPTTDRRIASLAGDQIADGAARRLGGQANTLNVVDHKSQEKECRFCLTVGYDQAPIPRRLG